MLDQHVGTLEVAPLPTVATYPIHVSCTLLHCNPRIFLYNSGILSHSLHYCHHCWTPSLLSSLPQIGSTLSQSHALFNFHLFTCFRFRVGLSLYLVFFFPFTQLFLPPLWHVTLPHHRVSKSSMKNWIFFVLVTSATCFCLFL